MRILLRSLGLILAVALAAQACLLGAFRQSRLALDAATGFLGEAFGAQEAFKQLALLTTSLTNDFRKTDLITRHVTDYWIIVPYDSDKEQIQNKIVDIFNAAKHKDLNVINREISIFSLPLASVESITKFASAIEFLTYLKTNKKQLAGKTFKLSANFECINA